MQVLDEQQKLNITVISVVAVLVANVSFLGYVTPPGGPHPYWEYCLYGTYIAFLVFNGLAFLFSLGAMGVVVVVPWLFPNDKATTRLVNRWTSWGLALLVLSISFFTVAFVLAGLVTGGYKGVPPNCGVLPCKYGGMACSPSIQDGSMASLLSLNDVYGDCFYVSKITDGQGFRAMFADKTFFLYNGSTAPNNTREDQLPDRSGCFMIASALRNADVDRFSSNTRNVLCHVGEKPGKDEAGRGKQYDLLEALMKLTFPVQAWSVVDNDQVFWGLQIINQGSCNTNKPGCLCSSHMLAHQDELTFVTYTAAHSSLHPQIFIANSATGSDVLDSDFNINNFSTSDLLSAFGQDMTLYSPSVYYRDYIAVYDELKIRCSDSFVAAHPTLCLFDGSARGGHNKWYKNVPNISGDQTQHTKRQCCADWEKGDCACEGLAVDQEGKYILMSRLGELGAEVQYEQEYLESLGRKMGYLVFSILALAFFVYIVISVFVFFALCHGRTGEGKKQ